jgi:hypothetical protein
VRRRTRCSKRTRGRRLTNAALAAFTALFGLLAYPSSAAAQLGDTGAFSIVKVFEGDALLRGEVIIAVSCSNGREETITIAPGVVPAPQVIGGLAPGTTCTVSEPVDGSNFDVFARTTIDPPEIVADPSVTPTVQIVNTYEPPPRVFVPPPGSIVITKVVEGDAALRGDIQIRVQCSRLPGFPSGTFDQTQTITSTADLSVPLVFARIPAPADCTVTEPATGGNDAVSAIGSGPLVVRLNPNERLPLTLTNNYAATAGVLTGTLVVSKEVSGPAAEFRGPVTLGVDCTDGTTASITSPPDPLDVEVGPLPFGTTCTVSEPSTGAIAGEVNVVGPTFDPSAAITIDEPLVGVTVTNSYQFAPVVELVKEFSGPTAAARGTVRLRLSCGSQTVLIDSPAGAVGPVTTTLTGVPVGTSCSVTELNNGATSDVSVTTTFDPGGTIVAGQTTRVTVTNTYAPAGATGELLVESILIGPAEPQRDTVQLTITCNGRTVTFTVPTGTAPDAVLIGGLPAGSQCTIVQSADGDTDSIDTATTGVPSGLVEVIADEVATVEITNLYTETMTQPPTTSPPGQPPASSPPTPPESPTPTQTPPQPPTITAPATATVAPPRFTG